MIEFIGKDHRLSVEERELYIPEIAPEKVGEYIYLQTCNRVELYRGDGQADSNIVEHLFRVVSGLESKMLGESHIQGQVKRAYADAIKEHHISKGLHRLFQVALRCGKRVRSETEISTGAVSHSHAAVVALKKHVPPAKNGKVLIIGVNDLTERIARFLGHGENHYDITFTNRTHAKALEIADSLGAGSIPLGDLEQEIQNFDAVVSATSSPDLIVHRSWFTSGTLPVFIDLALPRDIDPGLKPLPECELYNIEDLEDIVNRSVERRHDQIIAAEKIIAEEIEEYITTFNYQAGDRS